MDNYNKNHCWQYDIRLNNYENDIIESGLNEDGVDKLKVSDFKFQNVDKSYYYKIKKFIEKHEWLGRMSLRPTHFFIATYKGVLAGVVIMDVPNAFSKLLGDETKQIERLISRGACISWSPKNLASSLINFSINWMVNNTQYRLFVAYSDVEAKELGTIYQACNFYYLGKKSGTNKQYKIENGKWVSDRYFRSRSVYKRKALDNGIGWMKKWQNGDKIRWDLIPDYIENKIRKSVKDYMDSCESRIVPKKHKYAYVLGKDKRETKYLRNKFKKLNKTYNYPKKRGS